MHSIRNRLDDAKTFNGSRSHHCFLPSKEGKNVLTMLVHSSDKFYINLELNLDENDIVPRDELKVGLYIAAIYDEQWYIGVILDISHDNDDARIKFM
ncbi:MAG: hypothetical protein MK200_06475, partial [Nitrosopumilus sp.]|nr:hypothetical protein [Nitrosopumilus sp.]